MGGLFSKRLVSSFLCVTQEYRVKWSEWKPSNNFSFLWIHLLPPPLWSSFIPSPPTVFSVMNMVRRPTNCMFPWRTTASPARTASSAWRSSSCESWPTRAAAPPATRWRRASPWTKPASQSWGYSLKGPTTRWPKSLCVSRQTHARPRKCRNAELECSERVLCCLEWDTRRDVEEGESGSSSGSSSVCTDAEKSEGYPKSGGGPSVAEAGRGRVRKRESCVCLFSCMCVKHLLECSF